MTQFEPVMIRLSELKYWCVGRLDPVVVAHDTMRAVELRSSGRAFELSQDIGHYLVHTNYRLLLTVLGWSGLPWAEMSKRRDRLNKQIQYFTSTSWPGCKTLKNLANDRNCPMYCYARFLEDCRLRAVHTVNEDWFQIRSFCGTESHAITVPIDLLAANRPQFHLCNHSDDQIESERIMSGFDVPLYPCVAIKLLVDELIKERRANGR